MELEGIEEFSAVSERVVTEIYNFLNMCGFEASQLAAQH